MDSSSNQMDNNLTPKQEVTAFLSKLLPVLAPFLLAATTKLATTYKNGKKISFLSTLVVILLAGCGAILGYWVTRYLEWTEYKMTLTIYFFGIFSDKLFEYLFSKTFLNSMFNVLQDMIVDNLNILVASMRKKKDPDSK